MLKYWLSESLGLFILIVVGDYTAGAFSSLGTCALVGCGRVLFCMYYSIAFWISASLLAYFDCATAYDPACLGCTSQSLLVFVYIVDIYFSGFGMYIFLRSCYFNYWMCCRLSTSIPKFSLSISKDCWIFPKNARESP